MEHRPTHEVKYSPKWAVICEHTDTDADGLPNGTEIIGFYDTEEEACAVAENYEDKHGFEHGTSGEFGVAYVHYRAVGLRQTGETIVHELATLTTVEYTGLRGEVYTVTSKSQELLEG